MTAHFDTEVGLASAAISLGRPRPTTIFLVDDGQDGTDALRQYLVSEGFDVSHGDRSQRVSVQDLTEADVVILRMRLPNPDVAVLLEACRKADGPLVLILSDTRDTFERTLALELGADDIVGDECSTRELLARIRSLLRRRGPQARRGDSLPSERPWGLNPVTRVLAHPGGGTYALSGTELALLLRFVHEPSGLVVERDKADPDDHNSLSSNALRTLVSRMRRRFRQAVGQALPIRNVRGSGYVLDVDFKIDPPLGRQPLMAWS